MFDTDNDGLIDGLELFLGLIILSPCDPRDKIRFIFELFDFNNEEFITTNHLKIAVHMTASTI